MTDTTSQPIPKKEAKGLFQQLELDARLLGMIGAFVILCIGFNIFTDGRFLTPRNIFNLSIQTVSVAIMASGMVFVIVNRHIDLSVGALLATCSAVMAMIQTEWLPGTLGFGLDHPMTWAITIVAGLAVGTLIGAFPTNVSFLPLAWKKAVHARRNYFITRMKCKKFIHCAGP